jgi:hypothetical protein
MCLAVGTQPWLGRQFALLVGQARPQSMPTLRGLPWAGRSMTRLTVPHPGPSKPASVALSELAIAAGAAGQSVTLCYDGLPASVLCHLWKHCNRYAGLGDVYHVRTQSDIRKLTECTSAVRLTLVHVPRLRNATSWAIQMTPTAAEGRHRLPALFCYGGLNDVDDDPGATLVLRGDDGETAAVARWLSMLQPQVPNWASISMVLTIGVDPILDGRPPGPTTRPEPAPNGTPGLRPSRK